MTVMAERTSSQMSVDVFERIAEFAISQDETVRFEFIDGRIGLRKAANGNHSTVQSQPDPEDGYRDIHTVKLGGRLTLPDPVAIELDAGELKPYMD
jgi:predicted transcriptional regulator